MSLPEWALRDLTLQTPTTSTDGYGAAAPTTWADSTITGRIDQTQRSDDLGDGRIAQVSSWLLVTNTSIDAASRIVDGARTFEIDGQPWPAYAGRGVHHYEATLRLVEG